MTKYNILLHTENDFNKCLKDEYIDLEYFPIDKEKFDGIDDGRIYIAETSDSKVEWLKDVKRYSSVHIDSDNYMNKSNKCVIFIKYKDRIFSLLFGYGRTLIDLTTIDRNFGLKVAINKISSENIKSMNSLNISRNYIDIQRQAFNLVSQNELSIDTQSDILKSITGRAEKDSLMNSISGSEGLQFSTSGDETLVGLLDEIIDAYDSEKYKENGFGWIDHIKVIKNKEIINNLDKELLLAITNFDTNNIVIAPNRIISWEEIDGFFISKMDIIAKKENFFDQVPVTKYFQFLIKNNTVNIDYLKSSSLYFWNSNSDEKEKLDSIYNSLWFETIFEGKKYFINKGDWFEIDSDFYKKIVTQINEIPKSSITPITCKGFWNEGVFNEKIVAENRSKFLLFDKQNYSGTEWGKSKVEPADIITKQKQLIHVKKGGSSSMLSHLFAQAAVSAELLRNDEGFLQFINQQIESQFGVDFKIENNDKVEIVFGIIDKKSNVENNSDLLPFFSMVNLIQKVRIVKNLNYTCSILPIHYEEYELCKQHKKILEKINLFFSTKSFTVKELTEKLDCNKLNDNLIRKILNQLADKKILKKDSNSRPNHYQLM
ncbi:DUF6119 family protein [Streptococcus uberis]|uniref:DUF6119 family protein n=1 Tax=Streptococcus uberis TaxID=1349 RepID=UPI0006203F56|nr:DUF6119 family protein [Streptococcus uberis]KKF43450.1 hypothetical protein AF64_06630 [Streptococcus uberis C9359]KKF53476.1 hypothetical protein AF65_06700 [Streptococcus uberis C5388]